MCAALWTVLCTPDIIDPAISNGLPLPSVNWHWFDSPRPDPDPKNTPPQQPKVHLLDCFIFTNGSVLLFWRHTSPSISFRCFWFSTRTLLPSQFCSPILHRSEFPRSFHSPTIISQVSPTSRPFFHCSCEALTATAWFSRSDRCHLHSLWGIFHNVTSNKCSLVIPSFKGSAATVAQVQCSDSEIPLALWEVRDVANGLITGMMQCPCFTSGACEAVRWSLALSRALPSLQEQWHWFVSKQPSRETHSVFSGMFWIHLFIVLSLLCWSSPLCLTFSYCSLMYI